MVNKYPLGVFKTSTVDRGKEFACYSNIEEQVDMAVYFADPYASWQRGTNENANGLLREFFPKKTDLALITEEELEVALHLINHRPRKCLGWKTSYEAFWEEVSQLD
jgi:IS30 family transposase